MLIVFVDFSTEELSEISNKAIKVLEVIAPKYFDHIGMYYAENKYFTNKKRMMGITWDTIPSLGFSLNDNSVLVYPKDDPFEKDSIMRWIDDAFKGKIRAKKMGLGREVKDTEI